MLTEVLADLKSIHPALYVLAEVVVFSVLFLLAWFSAAIPLYLINRAVTVFSDRCVAFVAAIANSLRLTAAYLLQQAGAIRDEFVQLCKVSLVFDANEKEIEASFLSLSQEMKGIGDRVTSQRASMASSANELFQRLEGIVENEQAPRTFNLPSADQYHADEKLRRSSLVRVLIWSVAIIGLIGINTMLLNQFFRGLITLYFYNLPISLIVSCFVSLIEVVFGVALFECQTAERKGDIRQPLFEILLLFGIAGLAGLECFLYTLISVNIDPELLAPLFAPNPAPVIFRLWLSPMGFFVVVLLATAGHRFMHALNQFHQSTVAKSVRRQFQTITRNGKALASDYDAARTQSLEVLDLMRKFRKELVGTKNDLPAVSADIEKGFRKIEQLANDAVAARREPFAELPRPELERMFLSQIAFALLGLIVVAVFVWVQYLFLDNLGPVTGFSSPVAFLIALAETGIVLGGSHSLVRPVRIVLDGHKPRSVTLPGFHLLSVAAYTGIAAVILFNLLLTVRHGFLREWLWFAILLGCVAFAVYVGHSFALFIAALWCLVKGFLFLLAAAVTGLAALIAAAISLLLRVLFSLIAVLAYPMFLLVALFSREARPIPRSLPST